MLNTVSERLAQCEAKIAAALVVAIVGFIVLNVVTRAIGQALYWVDELVIYLMIWMVFISMSLLIRLRMNISVEFLVSFLGEKSAQVLQCLADLVVLLISVFMLVLTVKWFMPLELIQAGFDLERFSETTFNYLYEEPTNTLPVKKYLFWLAVPVSALFCSVHAAANLSTSLGRIKQPSSVGGSEVQL